MQSKTAYANSEDAKAFYHRKAGASADCGLLRHRPDRKTYLQWDCIRAIAKYEGALPVRYIPPQQGSLTGNKTSRGEASHIQTKIPEALDYIETLANSAKEEVESANLLKLY